MCLDMNAFTKCDQYVCIYFIVGMNPAIPCSIFNKFSMCEASVCMCARLQAFTLVKVYAYESGLVIECAQVARVILVSDRMMLGEAVHINPIHICEA